MMTDTLHHISPPSSPQDGPLSSSGSKSQARLSSERLQSALEARLKERLSGRGSTIYKAVWKPHTTPSGRQISRLRASALRTSDSGHSSELSGWPTPNAVNGDRAAYADFEKLMARKAAGRQQNLQEIVMVAGWPTTTRDHKGGYQGGRVRGGKISTDTLDVAAQLSGWSTLDGPARITADGQILTGSSAGMESGGQLNPAHSRWLMGYPPEWDDCAVTAMPSSRKQRPSS
jgi:hypothetical protein